MQPSVQPLYSFPDPFDINNATPQGVMLLANDILPPSISFGTPSYNQMPTTSHA